MGLPQIFSDQKPTTPGYQVMTHVYTGPENASRRQQRPNKVADKVARHIAKEEARLSSRMKRQGGRDTSHARKRNASPRLHAGDVRSLQDDVTPVN